MKFWTILYITIQSGQLDGSASFECLGTDAASSSLRPKANPFY